MRVTMFPWLGREFVSLSCEGVAQGTVIGETQAMYHRLDVELRGLGLSLDNTVRTRLWAKDRESRDLGGGERVKILSGNARSASSSYIAPDFFTSDARVATDLIALKPRRQEAAKTLKEYDPPLIPLRYLIYDSLVILSGVTAVLPSLSDQMADILPRIEGSLTDAGSSWDKAVKVSFFLHRSEKLETLKGLFESTVKAEIPQVEYAFVDGYSTPGKLIEIEVTAERSAKGL